MTGYSEERDDANRSRTKNPTRRKLNTSKFPGSLDLVYSGQENFEELSRLSDLESRLEVALVHNGLHSVE